MDHSETSTPELINQIYRLQVSLSILAEQLARQPEQREVLQEKALDYLYITHWYLIGEASAHRH